MNNEDAKHWMHLHEQMSHGKVDFNPDYYVAADSTSSQDGQGDISLVTPTQAQVDQAKLLMKRKLSPASYSFIAKRRRKARRSNSSKSKRKSSKRQGGAAAAGRGRRSVRGGGGGGIGKRSQRGGGRSKKRTTKTTKRRKTQNRRRR